MAIVDTINSIKTHLGEAYASLEEKQATIPSNKNIENLAEAILSVPSGGTPVQVKKKDVNFYDYDGTLLYSYTKQEALALESMPMNSSKTGLVSQGWNWQLSDLKTHLANYDKLNVGQLYITDDEATRLYVRLPEELKLLYVSLAVNGTLEVNWGDGNTSTITGTSTLAKKSANHTYSEAGEYIISLKIISGSATILGSSNTENILNGSETYSNTTDLRAYANTLYKVEMGSNITISSYAFALCMNLKEISISTGSRVLNDGNFYSCYNLKHINLNNATTQITNSSYRNCYNLRHISFGKELKTIYSYAFHTANSLEDFYMTNYITTLDTYSFYNCKSLIEVQMSKVLTTMNNYAFNGVEIINSIDFGNVNVATLPDYFLQNCASLLKVIMPRTITKIGNSCLANTYSLKEVIIPSGVANIGSMAFASCYAVRYDFSNCTQIPVLANNNAFNGIRSDAKIIVPDELYDDWKTASIWSNYASKIIKASDE